MRAIPEDFERSSIAKHVNYDLAIGALNGAVVSIDRLHRKVVVARFAEGLAAPAYGPGSLAVLVPRAEGLAWDDIVEIRRHPDIAYLRDLLREIEAEARVAESNGASFDGATHASFARHFHAANERLDTTNWQKLRLGLLGFIAGEFTGLAAGVPVIGGLVGLAASLAADAHATAKRRPRWVAADRALRDLSAKSRRALSPSR